MKQKRTISVTIPVNHEGDKVGPALEYYLKQVVEDYCTLTYKCATATVNIVQAGDDVIPPLGQVHVDVEPPSTTIAEDIAAEVPALWPLAFVLAIAQGIEPDSDSTT